MYPVSIFQRPYQTLNLYHPLLLMYVYKKIASITIEIPINNFSVALAELNGILDKARGFLIKG